MLIVDLMMIMCRKNKQTGKDFTPSFFHFFSSISNRFRIGNLSVVVFFIGLIYIIIILYYIINKKTLINIHINIL